MAMIRNKNQKGEIATFISIATLIAISVFTFVTANVNTNTAQKETVNTKAAEYCVPADYVDDYPTCYNGANPTVTSDGYNFECCIYTGESASQGMGDLKTSESTMPSAPDTPDFGCDSGDCYPYGRDAGLCNSDYSTFTGWCRQDGYDGTCCEARTVDNSSQITENTCTEYCVSNSCDYNGLDNVVGESCGVPSLTCCKDKTYTDAQYSNTDTSTYGENTCTEYCVSNSCEYNGLYNVVGESCGVPSLTCCKDKVSTGSQWDQDPTIDYSCKCESGYWNGYCAEDIGKLCCQCVSGQWNQYCDGEYGLACGEALNGNPEADNNLGGPITNDNFGCDNPNAACIPSGNGCDGSINGWCYKDGWGDCCLPYSTETQPSEAQNLNQEASSQPCTGECIYDGPGSNIDENVYEKSTGSCGMWGLIESCYAKKATQGMGELKTEEQPYIKINQDLVMENQNDVVEEVGLVVRPSFEPGAEGVYNYDNYDNTADIEMSQGNDGEIRIVCEPGIILSTTTNQEYDVYDENDNLVASGSNFNNICE